MDGSNGPRQADTKATMALFAQLGEMRTQYMATRRVPSVKDIRPLVEKARMYLLSAYSIDRATDFRGMLCEAYLLARLIEGVALARRGNKNMLHAMCLFNRGAGRYAFQPSNNNEHRLCATADYNYGLAAVLSDDRDMMHTAFVQLDNAASLFKHIGDDARWAECILLLLLSHGRTLTASEQRLLAGAMEVAEISQNYRTLGRRLTEPSRHRSSGAVSPGRALLGSNDFIL